MVNVKKLRNCQNSAVLIATDWEYDADFVDLLGNAIEQYGVSYVVVRPDNLKQVISAVKEGHCKVLALIDRASDTSPGFIRLQSMLHESGVLVIDPIEQVWWVSDKATLHLEFLSAQIATPYTLILPPFEERNEPALTIHDLAHLGRPFVIKPANTTGGGIGVVNGAESLHEVLHARKEFQSDKYLIQEKVVPMKKEGYRYWFRSFYVGGQIFTTWWNEETHYYSLLNGTMKYDDQIKTVPKLMQKISRVAMLTFFSSEIVYSEKGRWVVVDYVNESCDMRVQSKHWDGVPDILVTQIAKALVEYVMLQSKTNSDAFS